MKRLIVVIAVCLLPSAISAYEAVTAGVERLGVMPYGPVSHAFGAPVQTWYAVRLDYGNAAAADRLGLFYEGSFHVMANEDFGNWPSFGTGGTVAVGCLLPLLNPGPAPGRRVSLHATACLGISPYLLMAIFVPSGQMTVGPEAAVRLAFRLGQRSGMTAGMRVRYHYTVFGTDSLFEPPEMPGVSLFVGRLVI